MLKTQAPEWRRDTRASSKGACWIAAFEEVWVCLSIAQAPTTPEDLFPLLLQQWSSHMSVADKVARVHCAYKVGCVGHSTKNRRRAVYRLLCIVLPLLCKWLSGKRVRFSPAPHFSFPIFFSLPDGSCRTEITQSSDTVTVTGTDVNFQYQYDIRNGNYDSVYWYLQRSNQRLTYIYHVFQGTVKLEHYQLSVDRELSSSSLTILHVQPRDKAIYYFALRAPWCTLILPCAKKHKPQASSMEKSENHATRQRVFSVILNFPHPFINSFIQK